MKQPIAASSRLFLPLSALLLLVPAIAASAQATSTAASDPADQKIQSEVTHSLENKRFGEVNVAMASGILTLTGTVDTFSDKEDAGKRAKHVKNVKAIQNSINVGGPTVSDSTLLANLSEKLTYDRVGYGTTAFNAFTLSVQDGVVTLGGVAYGPMDKSSALGLVADYPGVKDLIDNVEVAPLSNMDDRIRRDEARAIYGSSQLFRYSLDPAKPIRITVVNGHVTLSGMVSTQADKNVAGIRANGVAGAFSVTNNLQVEAQSKRK